MFLQTAIPPAAFSPTPEPDFAAELETLAEQLLLIGNEVAWMKEVPQTQANYISLQTALVARRLSAIARAGVECAIPGFPLDLEPFTLTAQTAPARLS